ncbi:TPA: AlpA family transcriptional regulator [Klebsiella pneumoniae]|uniref:helix-turn-helix transcriptional regulator n=1 Tax=Klebsiella pneumoniae TaxID=573 RepID=UPI000E74DD45|nr:AlpA family transcriptional regulator [Klebsiella pneumoniae]RJP43817.1 DNA-binding protein [Klebsiella pneumoniae]HBU7384130.1 AlpA family transcriptional regulator [Klebsiella pneumoniae]
MSVLATIASVETKQEIKLKNNTTKRFIRVPEVLRRVGFGRTKLYELIRQGRFPEQVKIGPRTVAFVESEIDEWIEAIIRNSRQNAA